MKRVNVAAAIALLAWSGGSALAQLAVPLLREGEVAPGSAGEIASSIDNATTNGVGGYAIQVNLSASGDSIWGNAVGGPGTVLRSEMQIGALLQTSFEFTIGIDNSGGLCYAPSSNLLDPNGRVAVAGIDGLFVDDTPVLNEGDNVSAIFGDPNFCSRFNSRPNMTNNGIPYWIGGRGPLRHNGDGQPRSARGQPARFAFPGRRHHRRCRATGRNQRD